MELAPGMHIIIILFNGEFTRSHMVDLTMVVTYSAVVVTQLV